MHEKDEKDWKKLYLFYSKDGDLIVCVCQKLMSLFGRAPLEKAYRCEWCGHEVVFDNKYIYTKVPKKDFKDNKIPSVTLYGEDKTTFSVAFDQSVLAIGKGKSNVESEAEQ